MTVEAPRRLSAPYAASALAAEPVVLKLQTPLFSQQSKESLLPAAPAVTTAPVLAVASAPIQAQALKAAQNAAGSSSSGSSSGSSSSATAAHYAKVGDFTNFASGSSGTKSARQVLAGPTVQPAPVIVKKEIVSSAQVAAAVQQPQTFAQPKRQQPVVQQQQQPIAQQWQPTAVARNLQSIAQQQQPIAQEQRIEPQYQPNVLSPNTATLVDPRASNHARKHHRRPGMVDTQWRGPPQTWEAPTGIAWQRVQATSYAGGPAGYVPPPRTTSASWVPQNQHQIQQQYSAQQQQNSYQGGYQPQLHAPAQQWQPQVAAPAMASQPPKIQPAFANVQPAAPPTTASSSTYAPQRQSSWHQQQQQPQPTTAQVAQQQSNLRMMQPKLQEHLHIQPHNVQPLQLQPPYPMTQTQSQPCVQQQGYSQQPQMQTVFAQQQQPYNHYQQQQQQAAASLPPPPQQSYIHQQQQPQQPPASPQHLATASNAYQQPAQAYYAPNAAVSYGAQQQYQQGYGVAGASQYQQGYGAVGYQQQPQQGYGPASQHGNQAYQLGVDTGKGLESNSKGYSPVSLRGFTSSVISSIDFVGLKLASAFGMGAVPKYDTSRHEQARHVQSTADYRVPARCGYDVPSANYARGIRSQPPHPVAALGRGQDAASFV
ncbi:hypothetical protein BDK51DRAFT_28733 [Blyttiomyces helicus]|uniref:Uncharacterized protein n=1 Tax=Blyttiomyces helicus TaxID=388810 RepID=A0A4P9WAD4_9FUNG|nr:hypothetical protein BDK51DRAFT_28733 [Blyttiomyces helicus]|eukprot:RKO89394.1 hypothetical protein BDK51DRAFT_28733 [Blyttiomyces helicus]